MREWTKSAICPIGLDKSGYQVNIFLISPQKHRLWYCEALLISIPQYGLPSSFHSFWHYSGQITIEDFQDGCHGRHQGYDSDGDVENVKHYWHTYEEKTMVNSPWHKLTWSKAQGELTIEDLQGGCCGGHRGYRNKMFLAILHLHVAPIPPTKFWLNLNYHSEADEVWRFSRWPP